MASVANSDLDVRQNVLLAPFTTIGVGGAAKWLVSVHTEEQVAAAAAFARDRELPLLVLGGGSNVLVSDAGFPGLVLHMAVRGISIRQERQNDTIYVTAGAGEDWDGLVQFTVERDLQGMECLAGIPGTVGGTPVQNVGAYGQEIAQTLVSARCFDRHNGDFVTLLQWQFGFGYRTSLLNTAQRDRYIVTEVTFALTPGGAANLSYADLKRAFAEGSSPSLLQVAEATRAIRRGKGMVVDAADPDSRSAGSFFRNPIVPTASVQSIATVEGISSEAVPHWPAGDARVKLPAAWLLERAGFVRGYAMGAAGISSKHTLALINRGSATQADIVRLRDHIVATVRSRFGIELEQEPVSVS